MKSSIKNEGLLLAIITIMVIAIISAYCLFLSAGYLGPPPCIINVPHEMTRSSIESVNKMFPREPAYHIWYVGTREGTNEVCEKKVRVTLNEYERQVYKSHE